MLTNSKKSIKILVISAITLLCLSSLLVGTVGASTTYVSGFEAPTATFSNINNYSGTGSYKFINPADGSQWKMSYTVGGTNAVFQPYDATGNAHSDLDIAMGGISFANGVATQPENSYVWTLTQPTGVKNEYAMALYPLTWSIDFQTSSTSFEHIYDYLNYPVDLTIALNSGMWYFSNQPTSVYFGIAAITLEAYQVASTPVNPPNTSPFPLIVNNAAQTSITPSDLGDLLTINSPTNSMTAEAAFYSYEGVALNPEMFAPSVTTSLIIANLAPSQYETWEGVYSGGDVNVHLVFTVDTLVVGDWVVQPTYKGTTTPTVPRTNQPSTISLGDTFLIAIITAVIAIAAYILYKVYKVHKKR